MECMITFLSCIIPSIILIFHTFVRVDCNMNNLMGWVADTGLIIGVGCTCWRVQVRLNSLYSVLSDHSEFYMHFET
jgi:hypothetical protein